MNGVFSTQRYCEWRCRENRRQIVFTLPFLLENLSWACNFASVYAAVMDCSWSVFYLYSVKILCLLFKATFVCFPGR